VFTVSILKALSEGRWCGKPPITIETIPARGVCVQFHGFAFHVFTSDEHSTRLLLPCRRHVIRTLHERTGVRHDPFEFAIVSVLIPSITSTLALVAIPLPLPLVRSFWPFKGRAWIVIILWLALDGNRGRRML